MQRSKNNENTEFVELNSEDQSEFDKLAALFALHESNEEHNPVSSTPASEEGEPIGFEPATTANDPQLNDIPAPKEGEEIQEAMPVPEQQPEKYDFDTLKDFLLEEIATTEVKIPDHTHVSPQSVNPLLSKSIQTLLSKHSVINSTSPVVGQSNESHISYNYTMETNLLGEKTISVPIINRQILDNILLTMSSNIPVYFQQGLSFRVDKRKGLIFKLGMNCPMKETVDIETFLKAALKVDQREVKVTNPLESILKHEGTLQLPDIESPILFTVEQLPNRKVLSLTINNSADYHATYEKMQKRWASFENYGRFQGKKPVITLTLNETCPLKDLREYEEFIKNMNEVKVAQRQVKVSNRVEPILEHVGIIQLHDIESPVPFTVEQFPNSKVLSLKIEPASYNTTYTKLRSRWKFFENYGRIQGKTPDISIILNESCPLKDIGAYEEFIKTVAGPKDKYLKYKTEFADWVAKANSSTTISNANSNSNSNSSYDETETKRRKLS